MGHCVPKVGRRNNGEWAVNFSFIAMRKEIEGCGRFGIIKMLSCYRRGSEARNIVFVLEVMIKKSTVFGLKTRRLKLLVMDNAKFGNCLFSLGAKILVFIERAWNLVVVPIFKRFLGFSSGLKLEYRSVTKFLTKKGRIYR